MTAGQPPDDSVPGPCPAGGERPAPVRSSVPRRGAAGMLAAALFGLRDALESKPRDAVIEEAPEPGESDWLIWLDRDDPSRSLVIIPAAPVSPPPGGDGDTGSR